MDSKIEQFIQAKKIAVVGVSRAKGKFGTAIYNELKARGFEVYGVNPHMEQIGSDRCYASLSELAEVVDAAVICLRPQAAAQALRDADAAGIQKIWLQQGAQSIETDKTARELGLSPVIGKCILMYAGDVKSIHGFHKFFAKVLGQY
jgi:hypothetical protein